MVEVGTSILWTDGGQESQQAFESLMKAGEDFREFRVDVIGTDPQDPIVVPAFMDKNGIFEGLPLITSYTNRAPRELSVDKDIQI